MEYQKAFSYQFEDAQWPAKLGTGALISLVPILNFALAGYTVAIIRNVAAQAPEPLPHWDDLGRKFRDGLILALAGLVYAAPILLALSVPVTLLITSGLTSQGDGLQDLSNALATAGSVTLVCGVAVFFAYALVLSVLRPAILVVFSREGTFASCFRLGEIFGIIRRHASLFFLTWLVVILASMGVGLIVGLVGMVIGWIPCIGWGVGFILSIGSAIYLITVDAHLFGQFRAAALESPVAATSAKLEKSTQNPGDLSS